MESSKNFNVACKTFPGLSPWKTRIVLFVQILVSVRIAHSFDDVVTELVGRDLLDMELEEMAAMHDDSLEVEFGMPPKLFMRGPACKSGKTEIVFLLDVSDHVTDDDLVQLRDWMTLLVRAFEVTTTSINEMSVTSNSSDGDPDKTRIALVLFSNEVDVILDLTDSATRSELWTKIARIEKLGGSSSISTAINSVRNRVLSNSRSNAKKIVVLVTSSELQTADINAARKLKETEARLFIVGIRNAAASENIAEITSQPSRKFSLQVQSYKDLDRIRKKLKWRICKEAEDKAKAGLASPKFPLKCSCKDGMHGPPGIQGPRGEKGSKVRFRRYDIKKEKLLFFCCSCCE